MSDDPHLERMSIPSDPARFREVRLWIQSLSQHAGQGPGEIHDLSIALTEALSNAHRHAYGGRTDGRVDVEVEIAAGAVRVSVRDYGSSFDPQSVRSPELTTPLEGGYGVYLIRQLMDQVEFPAVNPGTEVVMWKRRRQAVVA